MEYSVNKEMQDTYLARRVKELSECELCLTNKDFDTLQNFGHKMKGNGLSFGFPELGVLGAKIEESAKEKDSESLQSLLKQVKEYLDQRT